MACQIIIFLSAENLINAHIYFLLCRFTYNDGLNSVFSLCLHFTVWFFVFLLYFIFLFNLILFYFSFFCRFLFSIGTCQFSVSPLVFLFFSRI